MNDLLFIVNPASGSGSALAAFNGIIPALDDAGIEYDVRITEYPFHATEIAKEAVEAGYKLVVAVGGDGTVNEVAQSLVNTDTVLGAMPFGTGNDLRKSVSFPRRSELIVRMLLSGKVTRLDACMANDRYFFNVAGFGFDVDVLENSEKHKPKFKGGMIPYFLGIVDAMKNMHSIHMKMNYDGKSTECDGLILSVGNGKYIGGGMCAVPMGNPFDGLLDCVYVEKVSKLKFIRLLPAFIKGNHIKSSVVHHIRCSTLTVECSEERKLNMDGEIVGSTPVTFKVLPGALKILLPEADK